MSIHAFGMLLNENFVHFPKFPMSTERLHRVFARYWRPDRRTVFLEKNLCFCSSRLFNKIELDLFQNDYSLLFILN